MLKIRLRRTGARKKPSYRIVVAESTAPRDGKYVEIIGTYDPLTDPATIKRRLQILTASLHLDYSRALKWSYGQAVLSAIWQIEDGYSLDSTSSSLRLAQALRESL